VTSGWIQYIKLAQREGARTLVGRICARAIQLHPGTPSLYILAASHELKIGHSPSAARVLLQRGVRMNKDSVEMWREWVRLEMGFIESLRRRWEVLGIMEGPSTISAGGRTREKGEGSGSTQDICSEDKDVEGQTEFEKLAERGTDAGAGARKEIMNGAIVKTVISSAAEALPTMALFEELERVVEEHPAETGLRTNVLGHLYDVVRSNLPGDARAGKMLAGRYVKGVTTDFCCSEAVEAVRLANEEFLASVSAGGAETIDAYRSFVDEWCGRGGIDPLLKEYLVACLDAVVTLQ